jgi:hypothetical protein
LIDLSIVKATFEIGEKPFIFEKYSKFCSCHRKVVKGMELALFLVGTSQKWKKDIRKL